jgi:hydrogenase 3 maturation protease
MNMPAETLLLCIGNRHGGDDAIGPYIFDKIQQETTSMLAIDCGTTPENYTSKIKHHQPDTILLIDAVDMGLPPGEIRIIPDEKLGRMTISTHGIPLSVLMQYLTQEVHHILLIGIQPKHLSGPLSTTVQQSGDRLIEILKKNTYEQIPML